MFALCKLFNVHDTATISSLARLGSGSACRSVMGGFVQWVAGHDMTTSVARQILTENDWPEVRVLVLVVSDHKKDTSSTSGMQLSVQTSQLIKHRASTVVPEHTKLMIQALKERDFEKFAEITMKESNQFHAICQDTYPPIRYMNDVSWSVVNLIHFYNQYYGKNVASYTFDAGPNACLYCLASYIPELISLIRLVYPQTGSTLPVNGIQYDSVPINESFLSYAQRCVRPDSLKYIISTKIGAGPQIITDQLNELSLLDKTGKPK